MSAVLTPARLEIQMEVVFEGGKPMKLAIVAGSASLLTFSAAQAACFGSSTFQTCSDSSGTATRSIRPGNSTFVDGRNSRTGSRWSQNSTTFAKPPSTMVAPTVGPEYAAKHLWQHDGSFQAETLAANPSPTLVLAGLQLANARSLHVARPRFGHRRPIRLTAAASVNEETRDKKRSAIVSRSLPMLTIQYDRP